MFRSSFSARTLFQYRIHTLLLRYSDVEQSVHEMEKNAQWTNKKSVQLPSNTNLAGGYILITTVLCMGISEIQNAEMKTQLSGTFILLGKLLLGSSYSLRLDFSITA